MTKKQRGRPPQYQPPERIDASPKEIAKAVLKVKSKDSWRFEEEAESNGLKVRRR